MTYTIKKHPALTADKALGLWSLGVEVYDLTARTRTRKNVTALAKRWLDAYRAAGNELPPYTDEELYAALGDRVVVLRDVKVWRETVTHGDEVKKFIGYQHESGGGSSTPDRMVIHPELPY